jgi:ferredoxin
VSLAAATVLERSGLQSLLDVLAESGYRTIGPTVSDGSIVFDEVSFDSEFPIGWTDEQTPGHYKVERRRDDRVFGYAVGPGSLKRYLFVPKRPLVTISREQDGGLVFEPCDENPERIAIIGAKPCDVAGTLVQDLVFLGDFPDPDYQQRRDNTFIVAVNCSDPAATCFCSSMGTGPRAASGFDLLLTELHDSKRHEFLVEVGTDSGRQVLDRLSTREATEKDRRAADEVIRESESAMVRRLETEGIRDLLLDHLDHPIWGDIANRCLTCANCTLACPTCFCSAVEDVTDLSGDNAERWQMWDSCFTLAHSYIHGGSIRKSAKSRYRQWLTHKLGSWIDQFGVSGCVGCGRCITWCPVGIDLTEEIGRLRADSMQADNSNTKNDEDH